MIETYRLIITVVLCIIVISIFHPQLMDTYTVGKENDSVSWHTTGNQYDMLDHVSVLDGGDTVPIIDDGAEYKAPGSKGGFWYDMNRLDGSGKGVGLGDQHNALITAEKQFMASVVHESTKHSDRNGLTARDSTSIPVESFGQNRAPSNWNERDYPIVTSNGLDLTDKFPQIARTHDIEDGKITWARTTETHREKK
jgi:hypothetical protein